MSHRQGNAVTMPKTSSPRALVRLLLPVILLAGISACGGGGGSSIFGACLVVKAPVCTLGICRVMGLTRDDVLTWIDSH